jgi:hypothetical protein
MSYLTNFIRPDNINPVSYRQDYLREAFKVREKILDTDIVWSNGDIYQFGVFSGISMISILNGIKENNLEYDTFWGFDSFCGIPIETKENLPKIEWGQGEFSTLDYLQINDTNLAANTIKQHILNKHSDAKIEMISGYFCDSLKTCPVEKMKPAIYVDIDVDIYSSAVEALEFLINNNLLLVGTLINYDDWIGDSAGEGRAHNEMCQKYGFEFKHIIGDGQKLFQRIK